MTKVEYLLSREDECLDYSMGHIYFSTLELASEYWQVTMAEEAKEKTTFVMHNEIFDFAAKPFELCNAPSYFSATDR